MNQKYKILLGTMIALGLSGVEVEAQSGHVIQELRRVRQQFQRPTMTTYPATNPSGPVMGTHPQTYPTYQYPAQYPVYVSPDQFNGYNPYTGRPNTKNEQVDNTYYDQNREASKFNGTRRWVRRPIHNAQGQVVGYQEGYVWTNSVTGVEHGELKNVTPNNQGGEHEQIQLKSVL
jgi:hypothetical protein